MENIISSNSVKETFFVIVLFNDYNGEYNKPNAQNKNI